MRTSSHQINFSIDKNCLRMKKMNVYDVHVYFVTAFRQSVSRKNKNVKEKQLLQRSLKSCLEFKVKKNLDAKANKCNRSFFIFFGKI